MQYKYVLLPFFFCFAIVLHESLFVSLINKKFVSGLTHYHSLPPSLTISQEEEEEEEEKKSSVSIQAATTTPNIINIHIVQQSLIPLLLRMMVHSRAQHNTQTTKTTNLSPSHYL